MQSSPIAPAPRRSALERLSRALLFTVLGLIGLVLVILLGLWVLNSFDQHELPATRAALALPPNPTPDDRNLYLAVAGFDAAPGASPIDAGRARITRYDNAIDTQQSATNIVAAASTHDESGVDPGSAVSCNPLDTPLWIEAKSRAAEFDASRDANREVFARYVGLHAYTGYYETARPSYMAPVVKLPRAVRCLYLAATAAALQSADAHKQLDAARDLAQDISMWRTVWVGDGTVLSKMLAANELHADLRLAAAAAADPATSPSLLEAFSLQPFDLKDWQMTTAYAAEFRALTYIFHEMLLTPAAKAYAPGETPAESPGWWRELLASYEASFFKYNATINLGAVRLGELKMSTAADPVHYEEARAAFERWNKDHVQLKTLRALYNPTGRILIALSSATSDYQLRAYDYAAFQRLVFLGLQIRQQGVAGADVTKFMAAHPEWSTHPVSGKFFTWHSADSILSMSPMAPPNGTAAGGGADGDVADAAAGRYSVSVLTR